MSQAFLNGFRASRGMGMGDVRTPQMRGGDQANTVSGNPGLAYNMPRMNTGATAYPAQMQTNDQDMFAQQQAMQGMPPQPSKPMRVRAPNFGSQLNGVQPTGVPGFQQAQMPAQQGFQRPMQAQYRYPVLASINSQGRRVYAQ